MTHPDLEALLSPIQDDMPCGADLSYDAAFMALEEAARGKAEQQFGDTIIAAQEPDWREVDSTAQALMGRTRDLRVLVYWLRARTRLAGLPGFVGLMPLVPQLLERHWEHVHPLLDADDNHDPTMRMNALAPLADGSALLADLRSASIGSGRGGLRVRDIELALNKAQPEADESAPSLDGVLQALADAEAQSQGLLEQVRQAHGAVNQLDTLLTDKVGTASPELKPLKAMTQWLADAAAQAVGEPAGADASAEPSTANVGAPRSGAGLGGIQSREDAIRALNLVCAWIERNEPSNPAPLLIRRAERLMSKNFMEIIRDLVPDGLGQVEKIAGIESE